MENLSKENPPNSSDDEKRRKRDHARAEKMKKYSVFFSKPKEIPRHSANEPITNFYTLGEQIWRGSNSIIYPGTKCSSSAIGDNEVAIKVFSKKLIEKEKIQTEIEILKRTDFLPNIAHLQEIFEDENNLYLVLELFSSETLFQKIVTSEAYSEREISSIICEILKTIAGLHRLNIVYKDLQPNNLLLSLSDFSLKIHDFSSSEIVKSGELISTSFSYIPGFGAPEIILTNQKKVRGYGKEVDLFSIGVLMYLLLSGSLPFSSDQEVLEGKINFDLPIWESISELAKDLIKNLLKTDPSKRFTAERALSHDWISKGCSNKPLPESLTLLKNWNEKWDDLRKSLKEKGTLSEFSDIDDERLKDIESEGEYESNMEKWFVGSISRFQAEQELEGKDQGTFLVRVGENTGSYVLSYVDDKKKIRHLGGIKKQGDGTFNVKSKNYKTIEDFLVILEEEGLIQKPIYDTGDEEEEGEELKSKNDNDFKSNFIEENVERALSWSRFDINKKPSEEKKEFEEEDYQEEEEELKEIEDDTDLSYLNQYPLEDQVEILKEKFKESREAVTSLMKNMVEYRLVVEDEKNSLQETIQDQKDLVAALQNKIQLMEQDFSEKINLLDERAQATNRENISNLQTLMKELEYIEERNEQLNTELENEQKAKETLQEELALSQQISYQLELKVTKLQQELEAKKQPTHNLNVLKEDPEKSNRLVQLVSQLQLLVSTDEKEQKNLQNIIEDSQLRSKLEAEKEKQNQLLQQLKEERKRAKEDRSYIDDLSKRVKDLISTNNNIQHNLEKEQQNVRNLQEALRKFQEQGITPSTSSISISELSGPANEKKEPPVPKLTDSIIIITPDSEELPPLHNSSSLGQASGRKKTIEKRLTVSRMDTADLKKTLNITNPIAMSAAKKVLKEYEKEEEILPSGWERTTDKEGKFIYTNTTTGQVSFQHPRLLQTLNVDNKKKLKRNVSSPLIISPEPSLSNSHKKVPSDTPKLSEGSNETTFQKKSTEGSNETFLNSSQKFSKASETSETQSNKSDNSPPIGRKRKGSPNSKNTPVLPVISLDNSLNNLPPFITNSSNVLNPPAFSNTKPQKMNKRSLSFRSNSQPLNPAQKEKGSVGVLPAFLSQKNDLQVRLTSIENTLIKTQEDISLLTRASLQQTLDRTPVNTNLLISESLRQQLETKKLLEEKEKALQEADNYLLLAMIQNKIQDLKLKGKKEDDPELVQLINLLNEQNSIVEKLKENKPSHSFSNQSAESDRISKLLKILRDEKNEN